MEFKFEGRLKLVTQVLMAIGAIALVGGFLTTRATTTSVGGPTC